MTNRLRAMISLLLVFVMCVGIIPGVSAVGNGTEPSTEPAETTSPVTEETIALEADPIESVPTDETTTFSLENCPSTTWATIWVNTEEYSDIAGTSNYFIYYEFPAGTAKNRNNIGLKAIKVDGQWQAAYCLEPGIAEGPQYNTEEMTKDEFLSSSYVPDTLSIAQVEAMCIAALYGQHTLPQSSNYEDLSNMVATQIIIWEIAIGWRDCNPPYAQTNDAFIRRFQHTYGFGPEATSSHITVGGRLKTVIDCYDKISAQMAAHDDAILSFASRNVSTAPTIELMPDGTGKYSATVTDTNGVLSDFSFTNTSNLSFEKNGNQLTITASERVKDLLVAPTKEMADANNHTYFIWYNGSYQVMLATPTQPSYDPIPAYFYVTTPELESNLELIKTTEDGKNLSGWQFSIYSDSSCSNLISGPHTTDASGKLSIDNLTAGTVYVKELGHEDSTINALYSCDSTNPQKVVLVAGETAKVSFNNKLNPGNVKLVKQTNTGKNLSGWQIGLYYDAACTNAITGSPFTTGADGTITVTDLKPGTLYAKEIPTDDPYWEFDTAVKEVIIEANQTATVTFSNTHYGKLSIRKTMDTDGPLDGWQFRVTDSTGTEITGSPFTSDRNGEIHVGNLLPGVYKIEELIPEDSLYYCKSENPQTVTVKHGETTEVTFTNALRPGKIILYKVDTMGTALAGATFLLEWSEDGTNWTPIHYAAGEEVSLGGCFNSNVVDGCLTSGEDGLIEWDNLYPGIFYRVTEVAAPDGYSLLNEPVYEGVLPSEDLTIEFTVINVHTFTLPETGSFALLTMQMIGIISMAVSIVLTATYRKRRA